MQTYHRSLKRSVFCALIPLLVAGCAQEQAAVRPQPVSAVSSATLPVAAAERDPEKILMQMAEFLARTPKYSVAINSSYEVVQASGQKIEFGEARKVSVSRPDGLRVEVEHSDGEKHLVLYDGKRITIYTPQENVYAQADKAGGIDAAVVYFLKDLHMRLPLAALLLSRLPAELENRTESLDYVENNVIHGIPVHHLAGRTETVDYQIWVPVSAQPLPLRVVLTYRHAEGQPSFRAEFSDWQLAPQITDNQFVFTPPEGARKIAFLAEMQQVSAEEAVKPEPAGEKQ
jgi:hypothetical protein